MDGCGSRQTATPANSVPEVAPSYDEAIARLRATIASDAANPAIARTGLPRLYEHGRPVRDAVILFHGFTNCPQQFDELARMYYERGCNVYVPRVPRHGLADRLTLDLANLTVTELMTCAEASYDCMRALGSNVSVVGLSMGGSMALWLAQTQPVHLSVPIAPFLMLHGVKSWIGNAAMRAVYTLPSSYIWWDPRVKAASLPPYAYPGFPTHGLAELVFFGDAIVEQAASAKPLASTCVFVLNPNDPAVNNIVSRELLATFRRQGAGYRELDLSDVGIRHDIIDPVTFPQGRELVYPTLVRLVLES